MRRTVLIFALTCGASCGHEFPQSDEGRPCADNATIQYGTCTCTAGHVPCSTAGDDCCLPGGPTCGNGTCEDTESWSVCPADCAFACGTPTEITGDTTVPFSWHPVELGWQGEPLYFTIDPELTYAQLTIDAGLTDTTLRGLAVDGAVLLADTIPSEAYKSLELFPFSTIAFPYNAAPPPTGCVGLVAFAADDPGTLGTLHVVTRRDGPGERLPIEAVIVGETDVTSTQIDAVMARTASLFDEVQGPELDYMGSRRMTWATTIIDWHDTSLPALLHAGTSADGVVPVYFIDSFTLYGLLGVSAAPAPNGIANTPASGVVIAIEPHMTPGSPAQIDLAMISSTLGHELGHQLGLAHTTEGHQQGHDAIADTPTCPISADSNGDGLLVPRECLAYDGANLMFWASSHDVGQQQLSPTQQRLMRLPPVVR